MLRIASVGIVGSIAKYSFSKNKGNYSASCDGVDFSIPNQPRRFAEAKEQRNEHFLNIDSDYDPTFVKDKVVLLTGANRGLGLAIANELIKQQAKVITVSRSAFDLPGAYYNVHGIDVTDNNCGSRLVKGLDQLKKDKNEENIKIDILINNAGYFYNKPESIKPLNESDKEEGEKKAHRSCCCHTDVRNNCIHNGGNNNAITVHGKDNAVAVLGDNNLVEVVGDGNKLAFSRHHHHGTAKVRGDNHKHHCCCASHDSCDGCCVGKHTPVVRDGLNMEEEMKMIDICALGPLRITSALVNSNYLRTKHDLPPNTTPSKVINITSQGGSVDWRYTQNASGGDYGHHMSKSAANMMSVLVSQELKEDGIAVGILHPGFNKTDMTKKYEAIWEVEGAVDSSVGGKRVVHEIGQLDTKISLLNKSKAPKSYEGDVNCIFINCEDGKQIPW